MSLSKIKSVRDKKLDKNLYLIFIFFILVAVAFFSAANLITAVQLNRQVKVVLSNALTVTRASDKTVNVARASEFLPSNNEAAVISVDSLAFPQTYSNVTSESFFGSNLVDLGKTNMTLDGLVTAMTFTPVYDFNHEKDCSDLLCGLRDSGNPSCLSRGCLSETNGEIFYQNKKIELPEELRTKQIVNITFSPLETKWIVGIVASEGRQEVGYVYTFKNNKLEPLITDTTAQQIRTQFSLGNGRISAGGSDEQFIVLYSGYEGFGFLYNKGDLQNLSSYLGLRVMGGGFKSKIIKGGDDKLANWYICSEDLAKPKLVKLWQNNTNNIQGAIDLSPILGNDVALCFKNGDRELKIVRSIAGKNSSYIFKDNGFKNDIPYYYQSVNLSDNAGQKIASVFLGAYTVHARPDLYSLAVSPDGQNWENNTGTNMPLSNEKNLDTFFVKADFKTDGPEYSPWFGGLEIISYTTQSAQ